MRQDTTSALSGLASFARLQDLLAARSHEGCAEATMTFEAFEVELGQAVRGLENELKAADLARYDVDADAVMVDGKEWRKCLEQPTEDLSERVGSRSPWPGTCTARQTAASASVRLSCVPGSSGVVHARAGATGRVHDGAHDLRRDQQGLRQSWASRDHRVAVATVCPSC